MNPLHPGGAIVRAFRSEARRRRAARRFLATAAAMLVAFAVVRWGV